MLTQAQEVVEPLVRSSPWSPELIAALGVVLTGILGGVGKLLVDLRAVSKQNTVIHNLVNSRMTLALTTIARLARSLAKLTGDPADLEVASDAEKALEVKLAEDTRAGAANSPFSGTNKQ